MRTWMLADLDSIIHDFMDQLQTATKEGWQRTKPDHYRALVAALETALRERRVRDTEESAETNLEPRSWASRAAVFTFPDAFRWFRWPMLSPVTVARGQ